MVVEVNHIVMIEPIHQDPADLALTIAAGKLAAPLTILKQETVRLNEWTLTFHIIGESHLVTIARDEQPVLCELLACVEVAAGSCLHQHHFGDLAAHRYEQPGYSIAVRFNDCADDEPALPGDGALEVKFPATAGHTPLTRIIWSQTGEHGLRWRTLHLYPGESGLVCVHSVSHFDALNYNRTS